MRSKSKKQSKAPSRLSNSDLSASPRTPSLTSAAWDSEEDFRTSLEDASTRYPTLIGKSAFIGQITDIETDSRGCKIWLSESSMLASSLAPGSLVSVSLPVSGKRFSNGFPLSSLADECVQQFGNESLDQTANQVGSYFALATVFPSCKVLKNEVRLSSSLSYTMGCPLSGRTVFVYTIQSQFLTGLVNGSNKPYNGEANHFSVCTCQELHLELVPLRSRLKMNGAAFSKMKVSAERSHDQLGNGIDSSPKTPMYQPRLSSQSVNQLASPVSEDSVSKSLNWNSLNVDAFDIKEVLEDESAIKLLQTCAASWLYSRSLLCGNLVAVPMLSEISIFLVIGANKLPADLTNERSQPQVTESMDHESNAFVINHETKVYLYPPLNAVSKSLREGTLPNAQIEFQNVQATVEQDISKLGGLSKEYAILKDIIISSSVKSTLSSLGLRPTKGVLLHGPPGTGKTSLARLCAHDSGVNLFTVNGPEVVSQNYGESEQALHEVFDSASQSAPAVVFIDELDAIAPARKDGGEELSQRMVATLLNLMDGVCRTDGVLVIAATNRPDSIEPALRRPGRLDREIEIVVPSPAQRLEILHALLSGMEHSLLDSEVEYLSMATHGFVGADLAALCNEAALVCLRRYSKIQTSSDVLHSTGTLFEFEGHSDTMLQDSDCSRNITESSRDCLDSASPCTSDLPTSLLSSSLPLRGTVSEIADNFHNGVSDSSGGMFMSEKGCALKLELVDFEKARMKVRPSAMREVILEVPKVKWEDVGGQREVKTQLMEAVEWPQKHQEAFKRIGTRPPTGILMFGPPGCSKTLMARAVASEAGLNFLAVKGPELFSKWVGESEKAVRSLFAKARANAPSIIFFDEIDGLAAIRGKESDGVSVSDRVMSQLLVELDGLHQRVNVTVIAATNRPDKIDPALLRPGRFDRLLYVGPPNETDREEIFRIHLRKIPCSSDVNIRELACLSEGCTGADISLICREAAISAIEENLDASRITMQHLKTAIRHVQPSEIHSYKELSAKFQRLVHSNAEADESGYQLRPSKSIGSNMWTLIKSISLFLCRFPAGLSQSESGSSG
ncbi:calmodulin-interacting protein 111 [Citrus sinensis]|uniref:calmodulin-interacting protein 111 isoform X1 n=2 Tax=Citrus sinensis TaxID=2711 RepID=UPI0003D6E776|nr:calmodulin-interacting protein 111 isoform X1 [Citrus sinensis]XP_052299164.1 calmodulin-interacting protein 111 isoform X1 [Citrus sinensis]KAH9675243.1 calmodulin-interacting protein 111 [Citrus sinensis]